MKSIKSLVVAMGIGASLALGGCGGGSVALAGPDFDIGAQIDGHPLAGFDVFPGEVQTLYVPVGSSFELDASGPVDWTVVAGGTVVPGAGITFYYAGVTLQEILVTRSQFVIGTASAGPLPASVPMTLYATSRYDGQQVATIQVVVTN
jgi:hypothetical protein